MHVKAGLLLSGPPCWNLYVLCCVFHLVKSDRVWNHRLVFPYLKWSFSWTFKDVAFHHCVDLVGTFYLHNANIDQKVGIIVYPKVTS